MVAEGALTETVQSARSHVCLELPIPIVPVKLRKPLAESYEFGWGEFFDLVFDLLQPAHPMPLL